MNTFYKNIQPTIIKFSEEEKIPESLRCHYAINYNVWGIDYFFENYLLQESNDGIFMILNEDDFNFILEDSLTKQNAIDIPRLYIIITEKFLQDDSKFYEFILKATKDNEIYSTGIEGFRPLEDYYINQTLFNYLTNINAVIVEDKDNDGDIDPVDYELPNYLDENGTITKYFIDLSNEVIRDYTNLQYFYKKNLLMNGQYSEDELNNFYQTFAKIILENTTIQNHSEVYNKPKNQIYELVLNYYKRSQVDDASIALNLILNSNYGTVESYQQTNCGCSNQGNSSLIQPCSSLYSQAMIVYLSEMLGNKEFYEDWFCIYLSEEEKISNDLLIESLQLFLREFIAIDYNLDLTLNKISYQCDCNSTLSLNNSSLEYKKINNFLQILDWVNNNEIEENSNKIKIYGSQFGELLPKLQF